MNAHTTVSLATTEVPDAAVFLFGPRPLSSDDRKRDLMRLLSDGARSWTPAIRRRDQAPGAEARRSASH